MKRSNGWLLLAALLPGVAVAQLKTLPPPTETRPVQLPPPSPSPSTPRSDDRSQDDRSQKSDNGRVEKPALRTQPASKPKPIAQPTTVRPVYDSNGQPANHLQQTSPNRVLDTRTNRYYDTVPSGTGQRVVPPPTGKK